MEIALSVSKSPNLSGIEDDFSLAGACRVPTRHLCPYSTEAQEPSPCRMQRLYRTHAHGLQIAMSLPHQLIVQ